VASARAAGGVVEALTKLPEPANLVRHPGVDSTTLWLCKLAVVGTVGAWQSLKTI
jgi:hypothetical protein